ncbi:MAG: hypothetical protein GY754_29025 [bacterium]|nr:hypothetical protein [bacterium]
MNIASKYTALACSALLLFIYTGNISAEPVKYLADSKLFKGAVSQQEKHTGINLALKNTTSVSYDSNIYTLNSQKDPEYIFSNTLEVPVHIKIGSWYITNMIQAGGTEYFDRTNLRLLSFKYDPGLYYTFGKSTTAGVSVPLGLEYRTNYGEPAGGSSIESGDVNYEKKWNAGARLLFNIGFHSGLIIKNEISYSLFLYKKQKAVDVSGNILEHENEANDYTWTTIFSYPVPVFTGTKIIPAITTGYRYYRDTGGYYSEQGLVLGASFSAEFQETANVSLGYQVRNSSYFLREENRRNDWLHILSFAGVYNFTNFLSARGNVLYFYNSGDTYGINKYYLWAGITLHFDIIKDFTLPSLIPERGSSGFDLNNLRSGCEGGQCRL